MATNPKLGSNIRRRRKELGLTQEGLAEKSKMDPKSIVDIENGKRNPTLKTLNKISNALKTSINELLN